MTAIPYCFQRDGKTNLEEFETGTDPDSAVSRLEIKKLEVLPDGRIRVTWNSNQDKPAPWVVTYRVMSREDLTDVQGWQEEASGVLPEGQESLFEWLPLSESQVFIKIESDP
jgi:hypothetical protein